MSIENLSISDDELFSILSHSLRRRILKFIFENGSLSFSTLANDWHIKSGPIYHHLRLLGRLIEQDEEKSYRLSEEGGIVCQWFLQTPSVKAKVEKIEAFTYFTAKLMDWVEYHLLKVGLISISLSLLGLIIASDLELLYFGGLLIPLKSLNYTGSTYSLNLILNTVVLILYLTTGWILFDFKGTKTYSIVLVYLFSLSFGNTILIIIFLLHKNFSIVITLPTWIIISTLNQMLFLFLNSSSLVSHHGSNVEKSGLFLIFFLYLQVYLVFLILI